MRNKPTLPPLESLFIKFGKFQAGASGRWPIAALTLMAVGIFLGRYLGMW
jgi:hypothetical protein